jgi:Domain of unknown function (DUF4352)
MFYRNGRTTLLVCMLALVSLLAACSFTDNTTPTNSNTSNQIVTVTTYQGTPSNKTSPVTVKAKAVQGSSQRPSSSGPIVVTSPTHIPGSNAKSTQVVLKDRTLLINGASKQNGVSAASSLITLDLTVKNTSNKPIMNQATFFQLIGSEGDTFSYQSNSSDSFYGTVAANSSHTGTIVFQIPGAAAHNLRLLYRPEIAAETALVALNI